MFIIFINAITVFIGCIIGKFSRVLINKQIIHSLTQVIGLICLSLGISGIAENLSQSSYTILFPISLLSGQLIGITIGLEKHVERWKEKFIKDAHQENNILEGIISFVFISCIGAMSIMAPLEAALQEKYTLMYTKSIIDGFTAFAFTTTYGFGMIWTGFIIFLQQGFLFLLAQFVAPYITQPMIIEINLIGGVLMMAIGLNILKITKISVLNMLPSLFISIIYIIFIEKIL